MKTSEDLHSEYKNSFTSKLGNVLYIIGGIQGLLTLFIYSSPNFTFGDFLISLLFVSTPIGGGIFYFMTKTTHIY